VGLVIWLVLSLASRLVASPEEVEAEWLKQAEAWNTNPPGTHGLMGPVASSADAAGAVDGVKDGKYAFHTGHEPNPWWQVDLGEPTPIARIVVYNRLDYAPGLHNADSLVILTSDDGKAWTQRYNNGGKHFGGISGAKPLEVAFPAGQLKARFVRLQIPSEAPIFFHLDEVEIYGPADPKKNLALGKPADQSSISVWSTPKRYVDPSKPISYPTKEVVERGRRLAADLRRMGADVAAFERELDAIAARLRELPGTAPPQTPSARRGSPDPANPSRGTVKQSLYQERTRLGRDLAQTLLRILGMFPTAVKTFSCRRSSAYLVHPSLVE
jgi:hypothetical protein